MCVLLLEIEAVNFLDFCRYHLREKKGALSLEKKLHLVSVANSVKLLLELVTLYLLADVSFKLNSICYFVSEAVELV